MNKNEFLSALEKELRGLPREDIEERLDFYSEMIDDKIEDGLSEEEAVAELGPVGKIAEQIVAKTPLVKIASERIKPKRGLKAWEIVLLALGSPIWLSLGIAVFAVIFSVYVSLWSVTVSLWAVFASFIASAVGGVAAGVVFIALGHTASGLAAVGAGAVLGGLSILTFIGCRAITRGAVILTGKIALGIKSLFIKKEA